MYDLYLKNSVFVLNAFKFIFSFRILTRLFNYSINVNSINYTLLVIEWSISKTKDFIVNSKFFWILFYDASNSYKSALNLLSRNRSNAEIFLFFWLFKDKQQKDATMHKCSSDLINSLTIVVSIFDRSHFLFQKVYLMWAHFYHSNTMK